MNLEKIGTEHTSLRNSLNGKKAVITRAAHQAGELSALLVSRGAEPVHYPCIQIIPPDDLQELDRALLKAARGEFDWLILTSTNTVNILGQRINYLKLNLRDLKVAAVGTRTAAAATKQLHLEVDVVPETFAAEEIVKALPPLAGKNVLLPQSALARPALSEGLWSTGAFLSVVEAYQTTMGQGGEHVPVMLASRQIDVVIFSSPSTVHFFLDRLISEAGRIDDLKGVCLAAIGPVTAKAMRQKNLPVDVQPATYTFPNLVDELADYFGHQAIEPVKEPQDRP